MGLGMSNAFVEQPDIGSSSLLILRRGVKKRSRIKPIEFSTYPFSQPDVGLYARDRRDNGRTCAGSGDFRPVPCR